ncbi:hypothetical protein [Nocardia sp. NPDC051570]|uniref:hypothetical protein n=1 Tax=Nocardia sp. NPDC051570 TaxID=3364324 RepID=UPI0037ABA472
MTLLSDLTAEVASAKPCITGRWFDSLSDIDRGDALAWLADGRPKSALLRVARSHGYTGSSAMFYAHSIGDCPCPRKD